MSEFVRRINNSTVLYRIPSHDPTSSQDYIYFTIYEPLDTTGTSNV